MRLNDLNRPGIYKIICTVNNKIYVGSAKNLRIRKRLHFSHLSAGKHKNAHLQAAYNLYSKEVFEFIVIEYVDDFNELLTREQFWLDETKCYDNSIGFNICRIAGSSLGIKRTDEFKNKIRIHNQNRTPEIKQKVKAALKAANSGKPSWNKGLKMWEDKQAPKANLGRKFPNRKLTVEGYMKRCEANRRPRSNSYHETRSFISSKVYFFNTPDSQVDLKIENLSKFCERNGLNKTRMYQVANGNERHHHGWTISEFFK